MATIVNKLAGYSGYTVSGVGDTDANGYVDYVRFSIDLDTLASNLIVAISSETDAFAARMGDGGIIILNDPELLEKSVGHIVIQFKMETSYPSNSPCMLVYHLSTAYIDITETS